MSEQKTNDIVYVIGNGSQVDDLELRLSLRSVEKFCPWVNNVFIVGKRPKWLSSEAIHIAESDPYNHFKDANIIHKILRACNDPRVSEDFMFCSDDQLVTKEVSFESLAPHWLREWSEEDSAWYDRSAWHKNLRETLRVFGPKAKYWQPHSWCPINKKSFIEMTETRRWRNSKACVVLSLYYNHIGQKGDKTPENAHVFSNAPKKEYPTMLAYSDDGIKNIEFRKDLLRLFPVASKYESYDITGKAVSHQPEEHLGRDLQQCIALRRQALPQKVEEPIVEAPVDFEEEMEVTAYTQAENTIFETEDKNNATKIGIIIELAKASALLDNSADVGDTNNKWLGIEAFMRIEKSIREFDTELADLVNKKIDVLLADFDFTTAVKKLLIKI